MTDQLIKLINENKSLSEICDITKLSRKQLFIKLSMLRQGGYLIEKQYNYNGEINYFLSNPFYNNKSNELIINSQSDLKSIRMILTSDSHYGHINENLECTDQMFNYCSKENIHLNTFGNAGMATAGSGDVLSGIIASICCMYLNKRDVELEYQAAMGVMLHGLGGDKAAELKNMYSMTARDIIHGVELVLGEKED